jgi:Undecaprenyl-phosphate glucose phosphotransferase
LGIAAKNYRVNPPLIQGLIFGGSLVRGKEGKFRQMGFERSTATVLAYGGAEAPRRRRSISEEMIPGLVGFADVAVVVTVGVVIHGIRFGWGAFGQETSLVEMHLAGSVLMAALIILIFRGGSLYSFDAIAAWPRNSVSIIARVAAVALLLTGLAFAFKVSGQFSRVWLTATTAASAILIWGLRGAVAVLIHRAAKLGALVHTVAVVGAGGQGERFLAQIKDAKAPWVRVAGVFDDRETRIGADVAGVPVRGTVADLIAAVRRREIDAVVITLPWAAEERLFTLVTQLRELPVPVYIGADLIGYRYGTPNRVFAGSVSVLEAARAPLAGWKGVVKAAEDKALAALALLVFGPAMALIAVAIKLGSPGPVLFRQKRYGFSNEVIEVFKFRTMHHDRTDGSAFVQAKKNDARVTRIGRLLRRTSLDELPQLFNVLNGTMSMVGPRPHPTALDEQFERLLAGYNGRHKMKPGITGLAQINGWRGETDTLEKMRARVEHDIRYVETWSLWLDVRILFVTVFLGWMDTNAY